MISSRRDEKDSDFQEQADQRERPAKRHFRERVTFDDQSTSQGLRRSVPYADVMTDGAMIDRFEEYVPKRYRDETVLTFQIQTGQSLTATGFDRDAVQPTVGSSRASSTTTCSPASSTTPADEMASCGSMLTSVA